MPPNAVALYEDEGKVAVAAGLMARDLRGCEALVFGNRTQHFRPFLETEFVGVLGGASFGTNLLAVPVMDYTRTLLINTHMAIGAFP